ncbi:MAG: hypothetical protein IPQ09_30910 [Myxococcales bacterium]|nr:hypothetical protein [Myxococcales bacterium]
MRADLFRDEVGRAEREDRRADTAASASVVTLFDPVPAMVTTSPTAKPSVTNEPALRVIVSPVPPTSAKMKPFDATIEPTPAAVTSAARSVASKVSTVAVRVLIRPVTLLSAVPATVTTSPTASPSSTNDPTERVMVSSVAPTSANVSVSAAVIFTQRFTPLDLASMLGVPPSRTFVRAYTNRLFVVSYAFVIVVT